MEIYIILAFEVISSLSAACNFLWMVVCICIVKSDRQKCRFICTHVYVLVPTCCIVYLFNLHLFVCVVHTRTGWGRTVYEADSTPEEHCHPAQVHYMYVCVCVCMYVCMYVCIHVCEEYLLTTELSPLFIYFSISGFIITVEHAPSLLNDKRNILYEAVVPLYYV